MRSVGCRTSVYQRCDNDGLDGGKGYQAAIKPGRKIEPKDVQDRGLTRPDSSTVEEGRAHGKFTAD